MSWYVLVISLKPCPFDRKLRKNPVRILSHRPILPKVLLVVLPPEVPVKVFILSFI